MFPNDQTSTVREMVEALREAREAEDFEDEETSELEQERTNLQSNYAALSIGANLSSYGYQSGEPAANNRSPHRRHQPVEEEELDDVDEEDDINDEDDCEDEEEEYGT